MAKAGRPHNGVEHLGQVERGVARRQGPRQLDRGRQAQQKPPHHPEAVLHRRRALHTHKHWTMEVGSFWKRQDATRSEASSVEGHALNGDRHQETLLDEN